MTASNEGVDPTRLDENMRIAVASDRTIIWKSPLEAPFRLSGFPWFEKDQVYRRLPVSPSHSLRTPVDKLANCTAGGQIRFRTDSAVVVLRAELAGPANMYHMPSTGQCGFDCYIGSFGEQAFAGTTRMKLTDTSVVYPLYELKGVSRSMRTVTINFPLYQGVKHVWIGLDEDAAIEAPEPYADDRRVIFYGTSITQGGCASRPGMAFTNMLSRRLHREVINLGFSGNGKGEPELAHLISQIEQPALLALDYAANVSADEYKATLPEFIRIYRAVHPETPILVISKIPYAKEQVNAELRERRLVCRDFTQELVDDLRRGGDRNVEFQNGDVLLGEDFEECTVDGSHPNDLGFRRMADGLSPILLKLLQD
jgi:lysophospholipase L1-like esterase